MAVQAFLGGLVVVRRYQQAGIGTGAFGATGQLDRLGGGIGAGAGNHRQAPAGVFDRDADDLAVLVHVERRGLAGGTDDHQRVGALLDVEVDQAAQGGVIQ